MNSVILDISIGLVFIYLIYALFVSLIAEIVATWLGMRARMLRQGITNLLNDHEKREDWEKTLLGVAGDFFLFKKKSFLFTKAGQFYKHPAIKYLAVEKTKQLFVTKKGKPAYIRRNTFSATLLDMLREKGKGIHDWDKIKFSIKHNASHFEPDTSKQLKSLLQDSNDDMEVFIQKTESWFDEMMDRVNGWYKRRLRFMLFWIGLIIVVIFNVNSFQIVQILGNDNEARKELVLMAMNFENARLSSTDSLRSQDSIGLDSLKRELNALKTNIDQANTLMGLGWGFDKNLRKQRFYKKASEKYASQIENIDKLSRKQNTNILKLDSIFKTEKNKKIKDSLGIQLKLQKDSLKIIAQYANQIFNTQRIFNIDSIILHRKTAYFKNCYSVYGMVKPSDSQKLSIIMSGLNPFKLPFWGIWVTALALSLGAPFWFDIMKKLVSIKNVGINGDEKIQNKDTTTLKLNTNKKSKRGTTLLTKDPALIALSIHREYWEEIPGVIAVNEITIDHATGIEITISENNSNEDAIRQLVKKVLKKEHQTIKFEFPKNKPASFLSGRTKLPGEIGNALTDEWGTCAGIIINQKTGKKAVLSCAHVLQGDLSPYIKNNLTDIQDHNQQTLGFISNQIKSSFLDVAIVDLNIPVHLTKFKNIPPPYLLTKDDRNIKNVYVYKKGLKKPTLAVVARESSTYILDGHFGKFRMLGLIKLVKEVKDKKVSITKKGDSGALVTTKININGKTVERSIGIIVGGILSSTAPYSYAIPITEIADTLGLEFIP